MNDDQSPEPVNDDPSPEEGGDDGLSQIQDELDEHDLQISSLEAEAKLHEREIEDISAKLNEVWPPIQPDESPATGNITAYYVQTDGGGAGDVATQCSFTYTVYALSVAGGTPSPTGPAIAAGIAMTGNGKRGAIGAMKDGHIGLGYTDSGSSQFVLVWVDEEEDDEESPITALSPGSGTTPDAGTWRRDDQKTAVSLDIQTREYWDGTGDTLYYFTRLFTFDTFGKIYSISAESQHVTDVAVSCS